MTKCDRSDIAAQMHATQNTPCFLCCPLTVPAMPFRKISDDLKEVSIKLANRGQESLKDVLGIVGFSERTYWRTLRRLRETGSVAFAHPIQKGRHRKLLWADEDYVLALMERNPTLYLDEYVALLDQQRAISVSRSTMHRLFSRHNVSRKKAAKIASERNKLARADFKRRISRYAAHSLLFLDETSKDERTYFRSYARAPKGQEAEVSAPFVRGHRYTLLPAMDMTGIVAYKVVEGSFDREKFITFLRDHVVCLLHVIMC